MKKIMMMCLLVGFCWFGQAQEALITGYVDSPCPSADGRTIEIYVNGTIDFTGWNLVRQSNGGGYATNIDISALGTLTDEFAYITNDAATLDAEFGIGTTTNSIVENGSINDNGNDAFQIIDDVATVIDRFGEEEVDGVGTDWEHTGSYYYRNDGSTANTGTFDSTNWTFGTLGLLDEEGTCNSGAALSTLVPFGSFVPASETCSLITTSFTEGFNTEIPGCWTVVNNDGGDYTWEHDTEYPHSGAGHLTLHYESDAHDDYLISPQFTVTSGITDQVSFYAGGTGTVFPETFDVKLSSTGTAPADFTEILGSETTSADVDGGEDYINYTYDISTYDGQNVYIAIVGTSTNEFYLYVDEFSINTPPSCPTPTTLTLENITTDSADIIWTAGGTETEWEVLYGLTGFDSLTEGTSIADDDGTLGVNIPGLTPATEYDVYVKAVCGVGDESDWTGLETFTTLATCPDPTALAAENITTDSADITWTAGGVETEWEVLYGLTGFDPLTEGTSVADDDGTLGVTIPGLTPATGYDVYVKAVCGVGDESEWVGPETFTALALPPDNDECSSAISITVNTDAFCTLLTTGTTAGGTASSQTGDVTGTPSNDVWFTFVATATTHIISLSNVTAEIGSSTDMGMALYDGSAGCAALVFVDDSDPDSFEVSGLTVGTTYYLRVYGWSGAQASFDICVTTVPDIPENDACADAIEVSVFPYTNSQNAASATNNDGFIAVDDCGAANDGVWYAITGDGGEITVEVTETSSWDSKLDIFTGTCGSFTCVDNTDTTNNVETLTFLSDVGTIYYVNIAYYSGSTDNPEGSFDLAVTTTGLIICPDPTGLTVENITSDSADITWTAEGTETEWEVLYGSVGFDPLTEGTSVADNDGTLGVNIPGLTPETGYDVYVKAVCTMDDESDWTGPQTFTTLVTCPVPTVLTVENITSGSADITWTAGGSETEWEVLYGPTGFDPLTSGTSIADNDGTLGVNIPGLIPATEYDVYVKAVCGVGDESDWTGVGTFTTLATCPVPTVLTVENITEDSADITWTAGGTETEWEVLYGPTGFDPLTGGTSIADNDGTLGVNIPGLTPVTEYDVYVKAICGVGDESEWVDPETFTTTPLPPVCGGIFVDSGGATGDYSNNESATTTILPDNPGDVVTITFTMVDMEASTSGSGTEGCFDYLTIYNGPDTSSPVLAQTQCGEESGDGNLPPADSSLLSVGDSFTSTDSSGALTIVFTSDGSTTGAGWEADVACGLPASCLAPTDLTIENITDNSADITWTAGDTETEWEVLYGPTGFDPLTGGTSIADNDGTLGVNIPGLTSVTEYDVYVKAICGVGDESEWTGPETFTTLPGCGDVFTDSGGTTGNYSSNENTTTTIMPENPGEMVTITFTMVDMEASTAGFGTEGCFDYLTIYNGPDTSSPVLAQTQCGEESGDGDLPPANSSLLSVGDSFTSTDPSGALTIVFTSDGSLTEGGWEADITCILPCSEPTGLTEENITSISAEVTWTAGGLETEWEVLYGPVGFDPTTGGTSIIDNDGTLGVTIPGLTADTGYDVYVKAICGTDNESEWVGPGTFTTLLAPCLPPTDITVGEISSTSAEISWTENGTAVEWEMEYGETGFVQGTGTIITDNDGTLGETITSLLSETSYDVYVRSICTGNESGWTGPENFMTDLGILDEAFQGFTYYPNPVNNELVLKATENIQKVVVYDRLGREVITLQPENMQPTLNMSNLQLGTYLMKVSINGAEQTFRIIKK